MESWNQKQERKLPLRGVLAGVVAASLILGAPFSAQAAERFDGEAAQRWIEWQCGLGSRVPGSPAHRRCQDGIVTHLDSLGFTPERLNFEYEDPRGGTGIGTNILARVNPGRSPRLLLGAHYDSRPWADAEADSALHDRAVPGANDGGSGVAVLMVLASLLAERPPEIGVDLALFDVEDLGSHGAQETFALGSQWLAGHYPDPLPDAVLVIDMVGSANARFGRELYSWNLVPDWVDLVPQIARARGFSEWDEGVEYAVFDDHLPFLHRRIPASLLIGLDDPYWHTLRDTPDKTSPRTLARVGEVVLEVIRGGYVTPR